MSALCGLTGHPGATVEDFDRLRRPFNSVHGGQHRRQHKAYLDWLKDDDEIPPLATGAVMITAAALWTRANAALVVEKSAQSSA